MALSPAMDAALSGVAPTICGLLEINLPGYDLRLTDGAGVIKWGAKTFLGKDTTYGTIAAVDDLTDGAGDEAPALSISLHPASNAAAASLASPTMQGSQVSLWLAAVNRASGQVVPDPELVFIGELDVPTLRSGAGTRTLEYECVSAFERFFANDEGARLSPGFHKWVWPGELGFDFVTGVEETVYWGVEAPPPSVSRGSVGNYLETMRDRAFQEFTQ